VNVYVLTRETATNEYSNIEGLTFFLKGTVSAAGDNHEWEDLRRAN